MTGAGKTKGKGKEGQLPISNKGCLPCGGRGRLPHHHLRREGKEGERTPERGGEAQRGCFPSFPYGKGSNEKKIVNRPGVDPSLKG